MDTHSTWIVGIGIQARSIQPHKVKEKIKNPFKMTQIHFMLIRNGWNRKEHQVKVRKNRITMHLIELSYIKAEE
jgi:hypothetical protein